MLIISALLVPSAVLGGVGFGVSVGRDWSFDMPNTAGLGDQVSIDTTTVQTPDFTVTLNPGQIPVFVSRENWRQRLASLGGRVFIDGLPVVNRIQVSANFTAWEYLGAIWYPQSVKPGVTFEQLAQNPSDTSLYIMQREPVTLESQDRRYFGIDETPFGRLRFDLTGARYLLPHAPFFDWYAGAGLSLHFATPVLTDELVAEALEKNVSDNPDLSTLQQQFTESEITDFLIDELIDRLRNPGLGMHVTTSISVYPLNWPLGAFVEAMYSFPITRTNANIDMREHGLAAQAGIELKFGQR